MNHSEIIAFLRGVADLIRDSFKRGKYQDVILPLTVLRRVDRVLAPTQSKVLATAGRFKDRLDALDAKIREAIALLAGGLDEGDRVFIQQLEGTLSADARLAAGLGADLPENARLTFGHVVSDRLQDLAESHFESYQRVTDGPSFAKFLPDWLFERLLKGTKAS
jgi:hypothetical protein